MRSGSSLKIVKSSLSSGFCVDLRLPLSLFKGHLQINGRGYTGSAVESVGGATQAVLWNRWAGLHRQCCGIGGRGYTGSAVESVGGATQAVLWNWWAGLHRQCCGIGGRG